MNRSQKRKYYEVLRAKAKDRQKVENEVKKQAEDEEGARMLHPDFLINHCSDDDDLEIIPDDSVHEIPEMITIPFTIHNSHDAVYRGGFVGCTRCAALGSTATKNNILDQVCRGEPKSEWAVRRLGRLLNGRHPRPDQGGGLWPNGDTDPPPPKRLRQSRGDSSSSTGIQMQLLAGPVAGPTV